jgi:phospholysine phosphohistidine inorganic pyrophosphate phosphatase
VRAVLLDLDGVLYVGDRPVPGAAETVEWLCDTGIPHLFLTNTTSRPRDAIVQKLAAMDVPAAPDDVLTPPVAAHAWLARHGIRHPALFVPEATAAELSDLDPLDPAAEDGAGAVVVGDLGEGWDFPTLNRAFRLLMAADAPPLLALGLTRYWRAPDGLRLDAGAFVRALEYATGRGAVVLGKPDPSFYAAAVEALDVPPEDVVMVGDDVVTDVGGAQAAGLAGVLVRTGKYSPADLDGDVSPDAVLDSVADLPAWWGAGD